MKKVVNKSLLAIAVAGILAAPAVNATNGYFAHGYSTKEKGLAGAGTAYSQDAMAAATNPAGMAFVGSRMDIGAALFSPSPRSFTLTGNPVAPGGDPNFGGDPNAPFGSFVNATPGTEYESDQDFFLIPHFAYNHQLDSESTVGVSVYGNGGMNTNYPASASPEPAPGVTGVFGAGDTGINLEQLFINLSYSRKLNDKHALGGSLIVAAQRFRAKGLENFAALSLNPDSLSGNTNSYSYGAGIKLGYQGEVAKGVRVGASYQSKISMGEFDEYKGLFAEGGNFDIPSTYNIGVSVDVGSAGVIVADIQQINYSDVASISNSVGNMVGPDATCAPAPFNPPDFTAAGAGCLGGSNGGGFGWEDMTVYKIGYQMDIDDKHTVRFGYSFTDQPIPQSETMFNILAPAVIEQHFTAGWTMKLGGNQEVNLAGLYAPSNSVKGQNPVDAGAVDGGTQIEIAMSQWEIQAGWAWKY